MKKLTKKLIANTFLVLSMGIFSIPAYSFEMEGNIHKSLQAQSLEVTYGSGLMTMDIYGLSEKIATPRPVIVMVHGGAWRLGDKANLSVVENKMPYFLKNGFIFVSLNYNLVPQVNPIEQSGEVTRALLFLQQNAKTYGLDPKHIYLMGHSSGAHISALAAADTRLSSSVAGVILLDSAAYDVTKIMTTPGVYLFYKQAFGKLPSFWKESSPVNFVHSRMPPMLLICSTRRDASCGQAEDYKKVLQEQNNKVVFYPVNLDHMQISTFIGVNDEYSKRILEFLRHPAL